MSERRVKAMRRELRGILGRIPTGREFRNFLRTGEIRRDPAGAVPTDLRKGTTGGFERVQAATEKAAVERAKKTWWRRLIAWLLRRNAV